MERENIGIQSLLETIQTEPEKYSQLIALLAIRLLGQETAQNGKGKPKSLRNTLITASHKASEEQIQETKAMVIEVLQEHFKNFGRTNDLVDQETYSVISRACMHLLGVWLKKRGQEELAHHVHSTMYSNSFLQRTRLALLDHGIVGENQLYGTVSSFRGSWELWTGHETTRTYEPGEKSRNIIVEMYEKTEGNYEVVPLIKGDMIHIHENQVLVFGKNTIQILRKNGFFADAQSFFQEGEEFGCSIEDIEKVETSVTKTGWHLHRITGTNKVPKENEEDTTITTAFTLCIHPEHPDLSFSTTSKRYTMNGNAFIIDDSTKKIRVLGRENVKDIPFDVVYRIGENVIQDPGNGNKFVGFTYQGIKKKLTFSGEQPRVFRRVKLLG